MTSQSQSTCGIHIAQQQGSVKQVKRRIQPESSQSQIL